MKKKSKQQKEMMALLYKMECELGDLPDLYQICERTGLRPVHAIKTLIKIDFYPQKKLITPNEKKVLDVFRIGLKVSDISRMTGLSVSNASKIMAKLNKKGMIEYKSQNRERKFKPSEDPEIFIEVTCGKYEGAKGYMKPLTDVVVCDIWLDGEFFEDVRLQTEDIREIKKRKYEKRPK